MSTISGVSSSGDAWANMKAQRSQMQAKMFTKVDTDSSGGIDKTELQSLIDDVAKKTGVANSSSSDELFSKMDANSDGSLSQDELGKGMKEILPPPSTMDFAQSRSNSSTSSSGKDDLFSKVDTDGSGGVSQTELQTLMAKMSSDSGSGSSTSTSDTTASSDLFAKLDANSDGSLSESEFDAGRPQNDSATQASPPTQGAGGPPPPSGPPPAGGAGGSSSASTTYDQLDTNEDGTVSLQERMAASTTSTDPLQALFKAIDTDGDSKISSSESETFIQQLTSQLAASTQSGQSTSSTSTGAGTQSKTDNIDLVNLVAQAYEQISTGLAQQAKGSTLSAVA